MCVLLIDDDLHLLANLKSGLELYGHTVHLASGGLKGFEVFKANNIDVVVTDILMSDGEGMETLGWINTASAETPVIGISGHAQYLNKFKKLGATAILKKPFKIEELLAAVQNAIRLIPS